MKAMNEGDMLQAAMKARGGCPIRADVFDSFTLALAVARHTAVAAPRK